MPSKQQTQKKARKDRYGKTGLKSLGFEGTGAPDLPSSSTSSRNSHGTADVSRPSTPLNPYLKGPLPNIEMMGEGSEGGSASPLQDSGRASVLPTPPASAIRSMRIGTPRPRIGSDSSQAPSKKRGRNTPREIPDRGSKHTLPHGVRHEDMVKLDESIRIRDGLKGCQTPEPINKAKGQRKSWETTPGSDWTEATSGSPHHAISPQKANALREMSNQPAQLKENSFSPLPPMEVGSDFSRDSTPASTCSTSKRGRGRPKKRTLNAGRPRKSTKSPSIINETSSSKAIQQPKGSIPANQQIWREQITFATYRNSNARIISGTAFPLNNMDEDNSRGIEKFWKNSCECLNDRCIYTFLSYLSTVYPTKKVVVVDSLITGPAFFDRLDWPIVDSSFNYDRTEPDIILIPLHFPPYHWTLVIHDHNNSRTWFLDSLGSGANRLEDERYPGYDERRRLYIQHILSAFYPGLYPEHFTVERISPILYTQQNDGVNCGFFVCIYAEAYLETGNLLTMPLNIDDERHRILWHLNELYATDDVPHHLPSFMNRTSTLDEKIWRQPINFATTKSMEANIVRRCDLPLYENDSTHSGPRLIETMWNYSTEWLNDTFMFVYLAYLTTLIATKRIIVIEPMMTGVESLNRTAPYRSITNASFKNYVGNEEPDIIVMPVNFPNHWTLIYYDRTLGALFFDSLGSNGNRLDPTFEYQYHPRRELHIKWLLSQFYAGSIPDDFEITIVAPETYTQQRDGTNCGFFVCLYAEAMLLTGNILTMPIDHQQIIDERHRLLWHINQLYNSNDVPYHPPSLLPSDCAPRIEPAQQLPSTSMKDFAISEIYNIVFDQEIELNIDPEPMDIDDEEFRQEIVNDRLSERSPSFERTATPVPGKAKKDTSVLPVTQRCYTKHKGINCASIASGHLPDYYDSGKIGDKICSECRNDLLKKEKCWSCYDGRVSLPPLMEYPRDYKRLVTGESAYSKEFIRNQGKYNSIFAFASLSVGQRNAPLGGPMPVLLNGEFQRRIGSLLPGDKQIPSFDQLYILDSKEANKYRLNNEHFDDWIKKDPCLFVVLDHLIRTHHPMAHILKNAYEFYKDMEKTNPENLHNFRIILVEDKNIPMDVRDENLHPRQVNLPTQDEPSVFAIWSSATDEPPPVKGIWVTQKGQLTELWRDHRQTDSLLYPLLFINGDEGYNRHIPYKKPPKRGKKVPIRDINPVEEMEENTSTLADDMSECETMSTAESTAESNISDAESTAESIELYGDEQSTSRKNLSIRAYIRYRLGIRQPENKEYHHIWSAGGGLNQKYLLDIAARIDDQVFNFLRQEDYDLRNETPENILEFWAKQHGLSSTNDIGRVIMFRKNMPGFRPYFQKKYSDACTTINRTRKRGLANFMLTFTSNPQWPEVRESLNKKTGQQLVDQCHLLVRFYDDKVKEIHKDLNDRKVFGKQLAYAESMEFQKRGGPHFHRVMSTDLPAIPEVIKDYIWAHIPKLPEVNDHSNWANKMRKLRELVIKHQLHDCSPDYCGQKNNYGKCKRNFPHDFTTSTILHEDRPAVYYRPSPKDGGEEVEVKKGAFTKVYTNAHVVSYSPFFLLKYETHHNVEFGYGEKTNLKYAIKYEFKGGSFTYAVLRNGKYDIDEIAHYSKMYYRSAPEAFCRILSMPYVRLSHTIIDLQLHLPDNQRVFFKKKDAEEAIAKIVAGIRPKTTLTEYWNQWTSQTSIQYIEKQWIWMEDPEIKTILYENMPEKYTFDPKVKAWKRRARIPPKPIIGRIYHPQPKQVELFALYVLLRHFPGNPDTLMSFNGKPCDDFCEAARLHGLLTDDSVWDRTLTEASHEDNPRQMRDLFVQILVFGNPSNAHELWEKFIDHMFMPVRGNDPNDRERNRRIDRALALIENLLQNYGMRNTDFNLPVPMVSINKNVDEAVDHFFFGDEHHINDDELDETVVPKAVRGNLNSDQAKAYKVIENAVFAKPSDTDIPRTYFLYGGAGTGKSFAINYTASSLRKQGIMVITCAYTGCAATLLFCGATIHSIFRFGLDIQPDQIPSISIQSFHGKRIRKCQLIIIDECSIVYSFMLEAIDAVCRQLAPDNLKKYPFGGKVAVTSGCFRQSLPVVPGGSTLAQVNACIQHSRLWPLFANNILRLNINMRQGEGEREFCDWLKAIGDGSLGPKIRIPSKNIVHSRKELINFITDTGAALANPREMIERLILAPHNHTVETINEQMLQTVNGEERTYYSTDESISDRRYEIDEAETEEEALNSLNPAGLPPHVLPLRVGAMIVLLRNIGRQGSGLVNGARMVVRELANESIRAELLDGPNAGTVVRIIRIWNDYKDKRPGGIEFRRMQIPVRVAFAMTIMKAQGQTVTRVGIDLTHEVFAHGNLHTALSRVRSGQMFRIYAPYSETDEKTGDKFVKNVVADGIDFLNE